jgi:hypothetical protein
MDKNINMVIILGMHKTGTSMIGGVLSKLGINMGIETLKKHWENPFGYFEDKCLVELNKLILKSANGSWDKPPDRESILINEKKFSSDIANLIDKEKKLGVRGWKDPRMSLTIDLYLPHLENPFFIFTHRNNQAVAESLNLRNGLKFEDSIILKQIYEDRIENFFMENSHYKRLDLYYEETLRNPIECVNKIIKFLEIQPSKKAVKNAINFILPNEKMHKLSRNMRKYQTLIKNIKNPFGIRNLIMGQDVLNRIRKTQFKKL